MKNSGRLFYSLIFLFLEQRRVLPLFSSPVWVLGKREDKKYVFVFRIAFTFRSYPLDCTGKWVELKFGFWPRHHQEC